MLGVVHGCGYDHPSLSHFSSMGFWHTGVPTAAKRSGWLGRLADQTYVPRRATSRESGNSQSLAVRSRKHSPLVFPGSGPLPPGGTTPREQALASAESTAGHPPIHARFLASTAQNPEARSDLVARPTAGYRKTVDNGAGGGLAGNLQRSRRSSRPGCRTRLFYVTYTRATRSTARAAADLHSAC
jgi:uncharacterized protein (DUF1501 family)